MKVYGSEIKLDEKGRVIGVWAFGEWRGVYRKTGPHEWASVLPATVAAVRAGLHSGRYEIR